MHGQQNIKWNYYLTLCKNLRNSYEGFAEIIQWISKHGPNNISNVNV